MVELCFFWDVVFVEAERGGFEGSGGEGSEYLMVLRAGL